MYKKGHRSPAESEWTLSLNSTNKTGREDNLFLHPTQINSVFSITVQLPVHGIPVNHID